MTKTGNLVLRDHAGTAVAVFNGDDATARRLIAHTALGLLNDKDGERVHFSDAIPKELHAPILSHLEAIAFNRGLGYSIVDQEGD